MRTVLTPEELAQVLHNQAIALNPIMMRPALTKGAKKGVPPLRKRSPVDLANYKTSWTTFSDPWSKNPGIINASPVAGVIERGARPHRVSLEGRRVLYRWVERKINPSGRQQRKRNRHKPITPYNDPEVWRIVMAIVRKLGTRGQRPRWVVRGILDQLGAFAWVEVCKVVETHLRDIKKNGP